MKRDAGSRGHTRWLVVVALVVAASTGCSGHGVDDVCERLNEACDAFPADECVEEGAELEQRARDAGCDDDFDAYLECVDQARCDWAEDCRSGVERLDACVGGLGD